METRIIRCLQDIRGNEDSFARIAKFLSTENEGTVVKRSKPFRHYLFAFMGMTVSSLSRAKFPKNMNNNSLHEIFYHH